MVVCISKNFDKIPLFGMIYLSKIDPQPLLLDLFKKS
jgi:hypothetical protein